ncbi:hypothetical protein ACF0H5_001662 [Mactra antiquata]
MTYLRWKSRWRSIPRYITEKSNDNRSQEEQILGMTSTQVTSLRTFIILGFLFVCGGVSLYYYLTTGSNLHMLYNISANQMTIGHIATEETMRKLSFNSTQPVASNWLKPHGNQSDAESAAYKISDSDLKDSELKPGATTQPKVNAQKFDHERSPTDAKRATKIQTIHSNGKIVLIVAYMRSGSTLTGALLQEHPKAFYVFEPIRPIKQSFKEIGSNNESTVTFNYPNAKDRVYNKTDENGVVFQEINSWLTCDLQSISMDSLTDPLHEHNTKIMKDFNLCYKNKQNIDGCLKNVTQKCKDSPLRVIKFIRLRMRYILDLLPLYPNMKVIHLVRDPRGILNSRINVDHMSNFSVHILCDEMKEDLKYTKKLLKSYPGRIKILHYENLAEQPIKVAAKIANFSGISFTKSMQYFIRSRTSSEYNDGRFETQRKNSTFTANKWRFQLQSGRARYIYNTCKSSNGILGYLPLNSTMKQRDLKIPSRKIVDSTSLLLASDNF